MERVNIRGVPYGCRDFELRGDFSRFKAFCDSPPFTSKGRTPAAVTRARTTRRSHFAGSVPGAATRARPKCRRPCCPIGASRLTCKFPLAYYSGK